MKMTKREIAGGIAGLLLIFIADYLLKMDDLFDVVLFCLGLLMVITSLTTFITEAMDIT
jgi:hypothetical protein